MSPLTDRPCTPAAATAATRISLLAVVVLIAMVSLLTGGTAAASINAASINAASISPASVNAAPAGTAQVPVMIVLDASGSMNQTDAPGPRIDAAKAAVTSLIDTLPAQTQVGLQVYGTGTGSSDAEKAAGCTDIKTLAPVAPLTADALKAQVGTVVAAGYTPIGNALRAAADALPNEGPRSIVLVSDGEDTCAPPAPCDVANELEQQGIDLTIHTVGFKVDPVAREQLACIAQATGGTYSDATDATGLTQALATKVDYAITGYTTVGTPVTGADQPSAQAPLLTPGQYVDTFAIGGPSNTLDASKGTTKYYTLQVQPGFRPYISATIVQPDAAPPAFAEALGVDIAMTNLDSDFCTTDRGFTSYSFAEDMTSTAVIDGPTFGDPNSPSDCPKDGVALLTITRVGDAWADQPLQVEIVVRMEPPADASALLPQAAKGAPLPTPTHGTPAAVTGGNSFNDAPRLTSGATYSDTIVTGQNRYYRVPLQWGQRLTYLISEVGPASPPLGPSGSTVFVRTYNPVRVTVTDFTTSNGQSWFADTVNKNSFSASTPYPARYTNRDGNDQDGFALDGDYYLRVEANRNDDQPSSTTFLITAVVSGDVEPGPVYQVAGAAGTSTGATTTTAASTTAASTPATPTSSADASAGSDPSSAPTGQSDPISGSAVPGWVWALAAVLAAGAVATMLVVRSRRRPAPPAADNDQPGERH